MKAFQGWLFCSSLAASSKVIGLAAVSGMATGPVAATLARLKSALTYNATAQGRPVIALD